MRTVTGQGSQKGKPASNSRESEAREERKQLKNKSRISEEINRLEQELNIKIELIEKQYIELTNRYLRKFNPNLEITKANKKGHQLVYSFQHLL